MQNTLAQPKPAENYLPWLIKIVSGVLIFAVLIIHFAVHHLLGANGLLSHAEIVSYYHSTLFVPMMQGFFLVFAVVHSLLGSRSIILDLRPSPRVLKVLDFFLIIIGLVAITYGIWLLFAVFEFGL